LSSLSLRNYIITDDNEVLRISNAKFRRLQDGSEKNPLIVFSGKRVRAAEIVVKIVDRKPIEVVRVSYSYLHFNKCGYFDQVQFEDSIRTSLEALLPDILPRVNAENDSDKNVVNACQQFAKRKRDNTLRWKPNSKLECKIFDIAIQLIKCKSL
jgi:hypothetical protein